MHPYFKIEEIFVRELEANPNATAKDIVDKWQHAIYKDITNQQEIYTYDNLLYLANLQINRKNGFYRFRPYFLSWFEGQRAWEMIEVARGITYNSLAYENETFGLTLEACMKLVKRLNLQADIYICLKTGRVFDTKGIELTGERFERYLNQQPID